MGRAASSDTGGASWRRLTGLEATLSENNNQVGCLQPQRTNDGEELPESGFQWASPASRTIDGKRFFAELNTT
jgi:hypothetical protein